VTVPVPHGGSNHVKRPYVLDALKAIDTVRAIAAEREKKQAMSKTIVVDITPEAEELANRPYSIVIEHDPEDGWIGRIPELPGHNAVDESVEAMLALAEDAKSRRGSTA